MRHGEGERYKETVKLMTKHLRREKILRGHDGSACELRMDAWIGGRKGKQNMWMDAAGLAREIHVVSKLQ